MRPRISQTGEAMSINKCTFTKSARAKTNAALILSLMLWHSGGCGMPGKTRSTMQSYMPNIAAGHVML